MGDYLQIFEKLRAVHSFLDIRPGYFHFMLSIQTKSAMKSRDLKLLFTLCSKCLYYKHVFFLDFTAFATSCNCCESHVNSSSCRTNLPNSGWKKSPEDLPTLFPTTWASWSTIYNVNLRKG